MLIETPASPHTLQKGNAMHQARSARLRTPVAPLRLALFLAAWLLCLFAVAPVRAQDGVDPPARVGRIALREGPVWIGDGQQSQWVQAQANFTLTSGDRLLTDVGGRAVLRIGSTMVTMDEASELVFERLDDEQISVRVVGGSVALGVRVDELASEIRIGSADVWLQPLREGLYRVQHASGLTEATSWRGELQVQDDSRVIVQSGQRVQLWRDGGGLQWRMLASVEDVFATRVLAADRAEQAGAIAQHVSPEMTGAEDLDCYGRWEQHPEYGAVWYPTTVATGWAPYRDGRWGYVEPWGWTWVDAAPWGFAPFHYGRWMQWRTRWVWVPGRYVARPVYAPALVAWIDAPLAGIGIRLGIGSFSWMPLAPWEVFRPGYRASPGYIGRIDPPDWRRHRPPPNWRGPGDHRRGPPPRGVSEVPAETLHRALPPRRTLPERARGRAPEPWPERGHAPPHDPRPAPGRGAAPVIIHPPTMSTSPGVGGRQPRPQHDPVAPTAPLATPAPPPSREPTPRQPPHAGTQPPTMAQPGAPLRPPPQAGQPQRVHVERETRQRLPERSERPEQGEQVERPQPPERPAGPGQRGPERRQSMR